jgi:thiosulfate/3-mercaptopyruvate sulfurtransferase
MMHLLCTALLLLVPTANDAKGSAYPRANLLIEAKELTEPAAVSKHRVMDVRPSAKYQAGRIPGAIRVDHADWAKAFALHPDDRPAWARRLGAASIRDTNTPVVVYGEDIREAARIWWILRYWGLKDVRLLNGGWQAWQTASNPVEKGPGTAAASPEASIAPQPARLASKELLLKDLKEKQFAIIDTRSEGEFCGEVKLAKRGGAIPGAKHLEWVEVIDKKTQRFKSAPELATLFQNAGIDLTRPTVTHCQSGGRASVTAFALELMGARDVRIYYRSWAEWGNAEDTPVARPSKK